jgi:hypothetical protein
MLDRAGPLSLHGEAAADCAAAQSTLKAARKAEVIPARNGSIVTGQLDNVGPPNA